MSSAYYNEIDPYAAEWLRNLIKAGHIAPGDVDERSIEDVRPVDLHGYTQCHFFAGIGVWSYALRRAGWPDDRPVWTGSCPCQPFSAAGKRGGTDDERHLWPAWEWLIGQCKPPVVFGEQVASKDGLGWLDIVSADLEGQGYAVGAADLCAAGIGAPHIRQRIWFVGKRLGNADGPRGEAWLPEPLEREEGFTGVAHYGSDRLFRSGAGEPELGGLADASGGQLSQPLGRPEARNGSAAIDAEDRLPGPTNGFWRNADWLYCRDGKWRPVEPGTFPLANGVASRVGRLRAYGNAINSEAAEAFIMSVI